jgi:hypothetical protein
MSKNRLLIVVCVSAVIGVIAGWYSGGCLGFRVHIDTIDRTESDLKSISWASQSFHVEYGIWPKTLSDLTNNPGNLQFISFDGQRGATDAWDRVYIYQPFDAAKGYGAVISYGRDGKPGGTGADADLEVRFGP